MLLNFGDILRRIRDSRGMTFPEYGRAARTPADYLLTRFLPEVNKPTYSWTAGGYQIRTTLAHIVSMDTPALGGGLIETTVASGQTLKSGFRENFPEAVLRDLQAWLAVDATTGGDRAVQQVLNFYQKFLLQSQWDLRELARARFLSGTPGKVSLTAQNGQAVEVDFNLPSSHILTSRTGTSGYAGTASKFWEDYRAARRLLGYAPMVGLCHPETADITVHNEANNIAFDQANGEYRVRRFDRRDSANVPTGDSLTLLTYNKQAEVMRVDGSGNVVYDKVNFIEPGKITWIATGAPSMALDMELGSAEEPLSAEDRALALGYTHIGPTVEGGGAVGMFTDIYTVPDEPWALKAHSYANWMPVADNVKRIVVASTEIPA